MTEQTCHMCGCPKALWAVGDESERDYKAELAAKDLLAALEDATDKILHLIIICRNNGLANQYAEADWLAKIRAAIAKARGE